MRIEYVDSIGKVCAVNDLGEILCLCSCMVMKPCPVHEGEWDGDSLILGRLGEAHQEHARD